VDAPCNGAIGGQGVVQGGVSAPVRIVQEGMLGSADEIAADDLARAVDAEGLGAIGGQGIVEGGVIIDWPDAESSLLVSLAENVDRTEPVSNSPELHPANNA